MKNRIISVILAAAMSLMLAGCGEDKESSDGSKVDKGSSVGSVSEGGSAASSNRESGAGEGSSASSPENGEESNASSPENGEESSASGAESGSGESSDKPKLVEERFYHWDENESMVISVCIYDDGGWGLSWQMGMQYYASYSFDEEAAGSFAEINGYSMDGDVADGGAARFTMDENTLTFQYRNSNGEPDTDDVRTFTREYR